MINMYLWIRTQDRTTLIKSYEIYIVEQQDKYLIRAKRTSHILGSYKSMKRALEVLDEIQNILKPKAIIELDSKSEYLEDGTINDVLIPREEIDYIEQLSTYVYEMPKE